MALTGLQRRFVQEYPSDMNATAAARRAGYSVRSAGQTGWRNMRNPKIVAAIDEAMAESTREAKVTAAGVLERLVREADGKGPNTSAAARVRASEILAKYLGLLIERRETGAPGAFDALSDDELDRAIETALGGRAAKR